MTTGDKIDHIYDILKGDNGNPGLCENVRANEKEIGYIKKKLSEIPLKWRSWSTFAITVFTFLLAAYIAYKKYGGG